MTEPSSAGSPHEASEPRYGQRLDPTSVTPTDDHVHPSARLKQPDSPGFQPLSFKELELPPLPSEPVGTEKDRWVKIGIIATVIYAVYGLILMLVIEPLSASPVGLSETYSHANM